MSRKLFDLLSKLRTSVDSQDPIRRALPDSVVEKDVERWIEIEDDNDVSEALCSDIVEEFERLEVREEENSQCASVLPSTEDGDDAELVTAQLPSLNDLYEMFNTAQKAAFNCNLPDASNHLHRALDVFRNAIREKNQKGQRQLLVTEMM